MEKSQIVKKLVDLFEEQGYLILDDLKAYADENSVLFDDVLMDLESQGIYLELEPIAPILEEEEEEELVAANAPVEDPEEEDDFIDLDELSDEDIIVDELIDFDYAKEIEEELMLEKQFDSNISIKVDDPVRMYLKEIGRVELLTNDE